MKNSLVPKLRFKEFSGEWSLLSLDEVTEKIQDGTHFSPIQLDTGNYMYITSKNIRMGQMDVRDVKYISDEAHNNIYSRCDVKFGDVLVTKDGSATGAVCINELKEEFSLLSSVAFLRANKEQATNHFIFQILASPEGQNKISASISGQAITRITLTKIRNFKFYFPSLPEQEKIASFLSAVDEKIAQLRRKKELLGQYKKGVMQQLFSGKLRFKNENGKNFPEWEEKKLGEVLDYLQPTKYLVESTEYSNEFNTPVLTAGKTFILGYTNETKNIYYEKLPVIIFDDFTTAIQFVDFPFKAKSSAMKILVAKDNYNIKFIFEAMQLIKFEIGGHGRHWISQYSVLNIPFPSLPEQEKIASFLSSLDAQIELTGTQLSQTQVFKKGLLQQLFV